MSLSVSIQKQWKAFFLDMNFSMESGCLGILGESGCGKSMTLKSIAGLMQLDSGKIVLDQRILYDSSKRICLSPQRRRTGYLFQNYALFPNMTVIDNIKAALPHMDRNQKMERTEQLITRFHLDSLQHHYPSELSGGQQQRTALARIFAYEPSVLLLDEPFSALDANLRDQMRLELKSIIKNYKGITILVTHDRDEAYQLCDQVLLMDQGHKLLQDTTKEVFEHPVSYQAAKLTGCKNLSRARVLDDYHVFAVEWNQRFTVSRKIPENLNAIGIRAHDLIPVKEASVCNKVASKYNNEAQGSKSQSGDNRIEIKSWNVVELPFEWHVLINGHLLWKVEKPLHTHDSSNLIPDYLYISPENILLLEGEE